MRAIGDVVLSTVILKNLREAFPEASIEFLTEEASRDVLRGNPYLESVITFNSKKENGLGLIFRIRSGHFDIVIDLFGNPRSALISLFSGARYRVGYRFGWRKYCYNIVVNPRGGEVHNTDFNLDALRAIEIPISQSLPQFFLSDEDHEFARNFFTKSGFDNKLVVAINPGGGWYTKRWPVVHYASLADDLIKKFDVNVLILWGPGEEKNPEEIKKLMRYQAYPIPSATLKQLAAILKRCTLLVTNDSGPMHIAAAMGVPVVAIFGPTNPGLQGPIGSYSVVLQKKDLDCLGCNLTKCPIGNPCMERLSVEEVQSGVDQILMRAGKNGG